MNSKNIIPFLILTAFVLIIEIYSYYGLKALFNGSKYPKVYWSIYIVLSLILVSSVVFVMTKSRGELNNRPTKLINFFMGFGFTILVSKLFFIIWLLIGDIGRFFFWIYDSVSNRELSGSEGETRRRVIGAIGLGIAAVPFGSMLYGITKGKYNFKVKNVTLTYPDLPESFDGFKIVQISDVHSGSFDDIEEVRHGVQLINDQNADVVVFTGDLVNNYATEIDPYIDVFKEIKSQTATLSITGNHDYGEYVQWGSEDEKRANFESLVSKHGDMGFDILMNEHRRIERGSDSIVIAGVENWGKPPFPQYGDMKKAFEGVSKEDFTVLLSHDPSHWDLQVLPDEKKVHLTLSGHTHGMQFGVDIPGIKWSPVKWRYPRWAGLYTENEQHLYVNKGFGFIGFPGRVGMWPEITVIELKKGNLNG